MVALTTLTLGACGGGGGPSPKAAPATTAAAGTAPAPTAAPTTTAPPVVNVGATAKVARHDIFASPVQPEPVKTLDNPQPDGAAPGFTLPLRMLVVEDNGDWLKVLLPIRPNGSSGWIHRSDVDLEPRTDYRIVVELGAHQITVSKGDEVVLQEPVGVGESGRTPTTQGRFFTLELYKVLPKEQAVYGPYAFSLSGYSEVHYSFGGGTGVLGIHGTSDPSGLGHDVSNGCIRMSNSGITKLAETLPPWGVPVEIKA